MLGPLMMNRERYNSPSYDVSLLWVVLCLLAFGMVMVYSASIAYADSSKMFGHNSTYFLMRQALYIAIGLLAAIDARRLRVVDVGGVALRALRQRIAVEDFRQLTPLVANHGGVAAGQRHANRRLVRGTEFHGSPLGERERPGSLALPALRAVAAVRVRGRFRIHVQENR